MWGRYAEDLTGQRFGKLTVVSRAPNKVYEGTIQSAWNCVCDCGRETCVTGSYLRTGRTKSCGCWRVGQRTTKEKTTEESK